MHSPVHEKAIFCQFLTFLEALKGVGLALHKFEDGIDCPENTIKIGTSAQGPPNFRCDALNNNETDFTHVRLKLWK